MGPVEQLTLSILAKNPEGLTREVIRAKMGYRQSAGRIGTILFELGRKGHVQARRHVGRTVYALVLPEGQDASAALGTGYRG